VRNPAPVPKKKTISGATHFFFDKELYARVHSVTAVSNRAAEPTVGNNAALTSSLDGADDFGRGCDGFLSAPSLAERDLNPNRRRMWTMLHINSAAFSLSEATCPTNKQRG